jgi:hypothetical protein
MKEGDTARVTGDRHKAATGSTQNKENKKKANRHSAAHRWTETKTNRARKRGGLASCKSNDKQEQKRKGEHKDDDEKNNKVQHKNTVRKRSEMEWRRRNMKRGR